MRRCVIFLLLGFTVLLTACGYRDYLEKFIAENGTGSAVSGSALRKRPSASPGSSAAPADQNVTGTSVAASSGGINAARDVDARMQEADYWITKTYAADKVLKKESDISDFNQKLAEGLSGAPDSAYYDINEYGEQVKGSALHMMMAQEELVNSVCYRAGKTVSKKVMRGYRENCGISSLNDFNTVRYGILCAQAEMRKLPTADRLYSDAKGTSGDVLEAAFLPANEPVLILYTSRDSQWYFVLSETGAGWVLVRQTALCRDKNSWQEAQNMEQFLIVTSEEITVPDCGADGTGSTYSFAMGTRLEIAGGEPAEQYIRERAVRDSYVVNIPARDAKGMLEYKMITVPLGKDVHSGYLDYTRKNLLSLSMKYLGRSAQNGGAGPGTVISKVFRCFGFRLPGDPAAFAQIPAICGIDYSGMSDSEKMAGIKSFSPGQILILNGLPAVYLGCENGKFYVLGEDGGSISVYPLASPGQLTGSIQ